MSSQKLAQVFSLARRAEDIFGSPQDVEWTFEGRELHVLQSRPITTPPKDDDSNRLWYLCLRRPFENLQALRRKIEQEHISGIIKAAGMGKELSGLSNADLAEEIEFRTGVYQKWHDIYWEDFIPFAHGVRLFAQVYNDVMKPRDPFEFMDLLARGDMLSLQRNRLLEDMAQRLRSGRDDAMQGLLDEFLDKYAGTYKSVPFAREGLIDLIQQMAKSLPSEGDGDKFFCKSRRGLPGQFSGRGVHSRFTPKLFILRGVIWIIIQGHCEFTAITVRYPTLHINLKEISFEK